MRESESDKAAELSLGEHLSSLARVLLQPASVAQTLQSVVRLALSSVEHCDAAGLSLPVPDRSPIGNLLATQLDAVQAELGEGPCRDVLAGSDTVYAGDLMAGSPWLRFGPVAARAGVRSVLAYRLTSDGQTLGGLQLYSRLPHAFDPTARTQGLLFAAHAGMALAVATASAAERGRSNDLETAMATRELIGQAQGILMERERITAEQAFELLRRASQRLNVKLRVVAQELVDTGVVQDRS